MFTSVHFWGPGRDWVDDSHKHEAVYPTNTFLTETHNRLDGLHNSKVVQARVVKVFVGETS